MPKDYSNTIIYKICCKDENIKDIYVGHTTNFDVRLVYHKQGSKFITEKSCKLYKFINQNGGWENWDMIELEKFSCNNLTEARIKEQEYYVKLNPSLNSCPPYVDKTLKEYKPTFCCEGCNYSCLKNSDYQKHLLTKKHNKKYNETSSYVNNDLNKIYACDCGKVYKFRQGLSYHKKRCLLNTNNNSNSNNNNVIIENFKVCKCKEYVDKLTELENKNCDYVSKIYALENQIKELENKVDKQFNVIFNLSQKILL